jgi:hypothetical protein
MGILSITTPLFAQNYDSTFFPIGVWSVRGDFRGIDDFLYNVETAASFHHTSFQNLKAQGFNAAVLSYEPIINTLDTILDIAEMYDLKVVPPFTNLHHLINSSNENEVSDEDINQALVDDGIELIKNSPATLGYYVYDEPLPGWIDFEVLENAKNILIEQTGGNHPVLSVWNDEQHMEYIDSYLQPDVLMMDAYPLEDGDAVGDLSDYMPSYFTSMPDPPPFSDYINTVRTNHCEASHRPLWVVFQAFGDLESQENWGFWRQVYPKEIRLQVYLSIMEGAKGLWYFLYESEFPYLLGMLDVSGQPTQRLTEAIAVNAEINEISDILLRLSIVNDSTALSNDLGEAKLHTDLSSEQHDKYIIAVNTDVFELSSMTITIQKSAIGYDVKNIMNISNGQEILFTETSSTIEFSTQIDEGSGVLIKLSDRVSGLENPQVKNDIKLFPNPAKNEIQVRGSYLQFTNFSIYNAFGTLIYSIDNPKSNIIAIDYLKPGVYFLRLETDKSLITKKFVKN